jgi:hypothetical protein
MNINSYTYVWIHMNISVNLHSITMNLYVYEFIVLWIHIALIHTINLYTAWIHFYSHTCWLEIWIHVEFRLYTWIHGMEYYANQLMNSWERGCKRTWLKKAVLTAPNVSESSSKFWGSYLIGYNRRWLSLSWARSFTKWYHIRPARESGSKQLSRGFLHEIRLQKELTRLTFFAGKLMMPSESLRPA